MEEVSLTRARPTPCTSTCTLGGLMKERLPVMQWITVALKERTLQGCPFSVTFSTPLPKVNPRP